MQIRDYQQTISEQACSLLRSFGIAYISMQVRTGKTITAINAAKLYGAKKVLFVTKLKAIGSILKDFELMDKPFDMYCINYESLHKCESDFDFIILDEAHCLGQYAIPSERTKELKRICKEKPIIYLSGTPSPESFSQMYHQFYVSSYSPFTEKTFYLWHKVYGVPAIKYIYNRQINDYSKTKNVMEAVKHLMISYTQEEAGFSSFVEEKIIRLPMPPAVSWAIKKLQKDKLITTKEGFTILADTSVKEMNKVHQMCGGGVKCEDNNGVIIDKSKAEYIRDNFSGKKIAIFYKYVIEGIVLKTIFGSKLTANPEDFNNSNDLIFYSQVQSGREGINLSTADCLIMYNIDFSAVSYWQARARLQTKDRVKEAIVYWLFFEGGIEEKIYKIVEGKKDFTLSHYNKSI